MRVRALVWVLVVVALVAASCRPSGEARQVAASTTSSVAPVAATSTSVVSATTTSTLDPVVADIQDAVMLAVESPEVVVAPGVLDGVDLDAGLPDGAVVTLVEGATVVADDVAEVLVDVSLPDGTADQFVVVLVNDGSRWLIAYTVKLS